MYWQIVHAMQAQKPWWYVCTLPSWSTYPQPDRTGKDSSCRREKNGTRLVNQRSGCFPQKNFWHPPMPWLPLKSLAVGHLEIQQCLQYQCNDTRCIKPRLEGKAWTWNSDSELVCLLWTLRNLLHYMTYPDCSTGLSITVRLGLSFSTTCGGSNGWLISGATSLKDL